MKRLRPHARSSDSKGVALIVVLSMLVLLSGLLVAFLTTARTERTAAAADSATAASRQIADSTVSFVIGQIRDATTNPNENITWASQPGAIRTFGGTISTSPEALKNGAFFDGYNPSGDEVFKLYSADKMKLGSVEYKTDLSSEVSIIEAWDRRNPTEGYVDLNEPVLSVRRDLDPDGNVVEPRYPVVDPRAAYTKTNGQDTTGATRIVNGFDAKITEDNTFKLEGGGTPVPYTPMPVKWLYVLRDGTIGPASLGTVENPIVGRTAFWTDDDSCKLNINTASEGTYWDTPLSSAYQECGPFHKSQTSDIPYNGATSSTAGAGPFSLLLAASQGVQGEYQRYPGHPASTCLSPVLGWLWDVKATTSVFPYITGGANKDYNNFKEQIYQMSPYAPYDAGTSKGATRNTDDPGGKMDKARPLKVATKHLYASVDELLFRPARFKGEPGTATDPATYPAIKPSDLEKMRFFLTTNSRAPELNLFGRPRVTIWPVNADNQYRTPFDDLFIFTSKIHKNPGGKEKMYVLLRKDAKGSRMDFNGEAESYTTSGFPASERDQNVDMFRYLQEFTSRPIPGFGKSFNNSQKFGGDLGRDVMLTLIFDYIRTINIVDTGTTNRTNNAFAPYTPKFAQYGVNEKPPDDQYKRDRRSFDWSGQVTPLRPESPNVNFAPGFDEYQGLGRFPIPQEVAVIFHGAAAADGQRQMQATMAIEMATVMPGYPALRETYFTRIIPKRPALITVGAAQSPIDIELCGSMADPKVVGEGLINLPNVSSHEVAQGRGYMPTLGCATAFFYFKEHKYTPALLGSQMVAPHMVDPVRENGIVGLFNLYKKRFDNTSVVSREYTPASAATPVGGAVNGTVSVYPYVSKLIKIGPSTQPEPDRFTINDLGEYEIQIWAGENPRDPRRRLVYQTTVDFPNQGRDAAPVGPFPGPVTATMFDRLSRNGQGTGTDINPQSYVEYPRWIVCAEDGPGIRTQFSDVVRSMHLVCGDYSGKAVDGTAGDLRLAAARRVIPENWWAPVDNLNTYKGGKRVYHRLQRSHGDPDAGYAGMMKVPADGSGLTLPDEVDCGLLVGNQQIRREKPPILPMQTGTKGVKRSDGGLGDWDRHLSKHMSGAGGNKVDEGNLKFDNSKSQYDGMPYFRGRGAEETGQTFFSPNRQLSSPVMFGSLPTGVVNNRPWQTLLFRPSRETPLHPGANPTFGPPDHLLLDLFTMPVIEPYSISEPFSTGGKININYVIAPFGYARGDNGNLPGSSNARPYLYRDSGVRGLLKSTMIGLVKNAQPDGGHTENPHNVSDRTRYAIDLNKTIEAMDTRLRIKDTLFRSASEICTVDLYPDGLSVGTWNTFWTSQFGMTGDNQRERPYSHIYPRVTTKSNVYTVHMRCQAIKKAKGSAPNEFDPEKDSVLGEYRGSATLERFIDPNDEALKDYNDRRYKVDPYYRYRVINTKQFTAR